MNYNKIVVIKHGSIGDFVMAFRAMKSIREHFSSSHITLVTTNLINKLFNQIPYFNEIKIDDRKSIFKTFNYLIYLKKLNAELVIDLQNSKRTQYYHFFTRIFYEQNLIFFAMLVVFLQQAWIPLCVVKLFFSCETYHFLFR